MERSEKHCSNCNTKYSVIGMKKRRYDTWTYPFCGYEVEDELDGKRMKRQRR